MKIGNDGIHRVLGRYAEQAEVGRLKDMKARKPEEGKGDEVVVSERARELQRAYQRLEEMAGARRGMVEAARKRLEAGTYRVSGDMVAEKLLKRS